MSRKIYIEHNDVQYLGEIGRVDSTFLGLEDHGIVTANIDLAFGKNGGHQGTGHYCLDAPVRDADGKFLTREGTAYGMDYLMAMMSVFGVRNWEQLVGKTIIALYVGRTGGGSIKGFASLHDESKILIFEDHLDEWKKTHGGEL